MSTTYEYDIAISFAGEEREAAKAIAEILTGAGISVFYDEYEQVDLWGKNLYDHLAEVYERKARYCLMLVSTSYANKVWTNHERKSAQARALSQKSEYILPVRFDETEIPGLPTTVGFLKFQVLRAEGVAAAVLQKLGKASMVTSIQPARKDVPLDLKEFWEQRKRLPDTEVMKKIWSKPRWRIWIVPTEFRKARFRDLDQCRAFMCGSHVQIHSWFPYPWPSKDSLQVGDEWIAGEMDIPDSRATHTERWVLFRSGQFVYNRTLNEMPQLGNRVHALEILDATTATFEFAARLAQRGVLSPNAAIAFELCGVDGRELTWPQDIFGDTDAVIGDCWGKDEKISVDRLVGSELEGQRRTLALEVALEIYSLFGWTDPPRQRLEAEQVRRFGAATA